VRQERLHRANILARMAETDGARATLRPVAMPALQRVLRRLGAAGQAPWLHGEVARRMAERLPVIRQQPDTVIDWWSSLGAGQELLAASYPKAGLITVERDAPARDATLQALARPWWSPRRWAAKPVRAVAEAELGSGAAQLVWANMMLHGVADPQATMAQWHRALAVDGFLMFSTLGPGTLEDLWALYRRQGWPRPFAAFVDMHDLGDMLVHAGFADPVMDQEQITLSWPSAEALLAELRGLGGNVDPARAPGLRTPRWRSRLLDALTRTADADGRIALTFEIVYGHAFKPAPRPKLAEQTSVPLDDMRAMVRSGRRKTEPGAAR
jgi:malonyl-CoA O-methyltransferase